MSPDYCEPNIIADVQTGWGFNRFKDQRAVATQLRERHPDLAISLDVHRLQVIGGPVTSIAVEGRNVPRVSAPLQVCGPAGPPTVAANAAPYTGTLGTP